MPAREDWAPGELRFPASEVLQGPAVSRRQRAAFPEAWHYGGGSTLAPGASALAKEAARVAAVPSGRSQVSAGRRHPQQPRRARNAPGCARTDE